MYQKRARLAAAKQAPAPPPQVWRQSPTVSYYLSDQALEEDCYIVSVRCCTDLAGRRTGLVTGKADPEYPSLRFSYHSCRLEGSLCRHEKYKEH